MPCKNWSGWPDSECRPGGFFRKLNLLVLFCFLTNSKASQRVQQPLLNLGVWWFWTGSAFHFWGRLGPAGRAAGRGASSLLSAWSAVVVSSWCDDWVFCFRFPDLRQAPLRRVEALGPSDQTSSCWVSPHGRRWVALLWPEVRHAGSSVPTVRADLEPLWSGHRTPWAPRTSRISADPAIWVPFPSGS